MAQGVNGGVTRSLQGLCSPSGKMLLPAPATSFHCDRERRAGQGRALLPTQSWWSFDHICTAKSRVSSGFLSLLMNQETWALRKHAPVSLWVASSSLSMSLPGVTTMPSAPCPSPAALQPCIHWMAPSLSASPGPVGS